MCAGAFFVENMAEKSLFLQINIEKQKKIMQNAQKHWDISQECGMILKVTVL